VRVGEPGCHDEAAAIDLEVPATGDGHGRDSIPVYRHVRAAARGTGPIDHSAPTKDDLMH
jgi:hypothetical protein